MRSSKGVGHNDSIVLIGSRYGFLIGWVLHLHAVLGLFRRLNLIPRLLGFPACLLTLAL